MPITTSINGRLTSHPLASQVRSIERSRKSDPGRLVQWFNWLEESLPWFSREYPSLEPDDKGLFRELQVVYEVIMSRSFKGATITAVGIRSTHLNIFETIKEMVAVVAGGFATGLIITGPGGLGKTFTVSEKLNQLGKVEGRDYIRVPGYSTPLGLYNLLQDNQQKLFVFDDCDSIFKDMIGLNILKSTLDTLPTRTVCWNSSKIPPGRERFSFTGRIIFISNEDPSKSTNRSYQALLTRVLTLVVGATPYEILQHMIRLLPVIAQDLTIEDRVEIRQFLETEYTKIENLSIRWLVNLVGLFKYDREKWQALALVMM